MTMRKMLWTAIIGSCLFAAVLSVSDLIPGKLFINDAQARVGRPRTPGSVAGVARRTTRRRVIRRSNVFVNTLPSNCRSVVIEGTKLYQCGTTYYQNYQSRYVVVYVN